MSENSRLKDMLLSIRNIIKGNNVCEKDQINPKFDRKIKIIDEELNKITTSTCDNYIKIDRLLNIKKFFTTNNQVIDSKRLIVIKKSGIEGACANYSSLALCKPHQCLICPNSDYRIMTEDGEIIQDFIYYGNKKSEYMKVDTYTIELTDKIEGNLIEYLIDKNSDYRLIRNSDNIVVIPNKEDIEYKHENNAFILKYDKESKKCKKYV